MQYFNDGSADGFVLVSESGHKLVGGEGVAEFNAPSRSNICNELSVAIAVAGLPGTPNKKTTTTSASTFDAASLYEDANRRPCEATRLYLFGGMASGS